MNRKVMKLASRGKRFGAFCIDIAVPAAAGLSIMTAGLILAFSNPYYGGGFGDPGFGYDYGYGGFGYRGASAAGMIMLVTVMSVLFMVYLVTQIVLYTKSKTIGKAVLGLQVVSSENGEPVGFWKMLFREWFVKGASGCVFCLGFIWILIDERNRGWHDKILDTYVVDIKESESLISESQITENYVMDGEVYE